MQIKKKKLEWLTKTLKLKEHLVEYQIKPD